MGAYEAILLATARREEDNALSARRIVNGKPALEWVIDAVRSSPAVRGITVIGPDELDDLLCMRYVDRRLPPLALADRTFNQASKDGRSGYVLISTECLLVSPALIENLIRDFDTGKTPIVIPSVSVEKMSGWSHDVRDLVHHDGTMLVPGLIALIHDPSDLLTAVNQLSSLHHQRDPLRNSGIVVQTAATAESMISNREIQYTESPDPAPAVSIATDEDLHRAETLLVPPPRPHFDRVKLIVNPQSGLGPPLPGTVKKLIGMKRKGEGAARNPREQLDLILSSLERFGIRADAVITRKPSDAVKAVRECTRTGCELVIAAGGDGTINEVVNGLAGTETALGIIPLGTINVFALQLHIPFDIMSACELIANGNVREIDLGKAGNRYFSSLAGIGFDAFVISRTSSKIKRLLGAASYSVLGIMDFFRYHFRSVRLRIGDDPAIHSGFMVVVGNGKYYTSNLITSPKADIHDGLLDVVIFRKKDIRSIRQYFKALHEGNLDTCPGVEYYQTTRVHIDRHGRHHVHLDGDYYGRSPVEITIAPSSLKVIC